MRFRPATPADDDILWDMLEPVFRAGETYCVPRDVTRVAALTYWGGGGHSVWIAEDEGQVAGSYFVCANQRGGGAHVCNCGFVTADAARGRGVARAMLNHALGVAQEAGYLAMQFNFVVETNTRAIAIWEGAGFDVVGRLPGAFDHPTRGYVDALVMFKTL